MQDWQLLDDYARHGSQPAFRQIVLRHAGLVYATCRRFLKDGHLAEDVTQTVFMTLLRKAGSIHRSTALSGWLSKTARYVTNNTLRLDAIRRKHERRAARLAQPGANDCARTIDEAELEDALGRLDKNERRAIQLRYFEGRSMRDVGIALGVSEEAARKRVARARVRLRRLLGPMSPAIGLLKGTLFMAAASKVKTAALAVILILLLGISVGVILHEMNTGRSSQTITERVPAAQPSVPVPLPPAAPAAVAPPIQHHLPQYDAYPYLKGFPILLPGSVTGSPVPADLDGDGKPEIVFPSVGRPDAFRQLYEAHLHPSPSLSALIYAMRADGTMFPNFPVLIRDPSFRKFRVHLDWQWNFTPSIADVDRDGRDDLIVGARILYGDGMHLMYVDGHDPYGSIPLADLDGDGQLDMVHGWFAMNVRGEKIGGWKDRQGFGNGYSPAVGDADNDGLPEIYHPHYSDRGVVGGYDHNGKPLPGWPQRVKNACIYVAMGDVDGDGKAEVVGVDESGQVHLWHHDGRPLPACKAIGDCTSVFKTGVEAFYCHPTLADLDGDGAAEIIILDRGNGCVWAWKADGSPGWPHENARPDGLLVKLANPKTLGGVSVADLGGDGVMDLFVGTSWIKLKKGSAPEVVEMVPGNPQSTVVPTITDLDKDGLADILFGTVDGRLFVYKTGLEYDPLWVQWGTQEGNLHHTSMWKAQRGK